MNFIPPRELGRRQGIVALFDVGLVILEAGFFHEAHFLGVVAGQPAVGKWLRKERANDDFGITLRDVQIKAVPIGFAVVVQQPFELPGL